ncbi:MAG: DinB family protein [Candidatus Latescibacteria bacterium]|nr:DinB family protein [Candidatus Latescibacterota bacterium]
MAKWLERRFGYEPPAGEFPAIVERLRGTPARVEEKAARIAEATRLCKRGDEWSIQEHLGHLVDLESLWARRTQELLAGAKEMSAADMSNRATSDRHHNQRAIAAIVAEFRVARSRWLERLAAASDADVVRTALHPRLQRPMRLIDLCFFVAEHDDHHLAIVTRLSRAHER